MILKQQIPDIIALEIDLLLVKFCSCFLFHSIIDMFVNVFCAISWRIPFGFSNFYIEIVIDGFSLALGDLCTMLCHSSICFSHSFTCVLIEFQLERRQNYLHFSERKRKKSLHDCVIGDVRTMSYVKSSKIMLSSWNNKLQAECMWLRKATCNPKKGRWSWRPSSAFNVSRLNIMHD